MNLGTSEEMKTLDRLAIEHFGLPGIVLMENAAQSIARAVFDFWVQWPSRPEVVVLIGPGQNGGDGWALARIFSGRGFKVKCFLVKREDQEVGGDAAINYQVARNLGLSIAVIEKDGDQLPDWDKAGIIIDALFGTGLSGPLTGPAATVLQAAVAAKRERQESLRILAVDLPSGLCGDTGKSWGPPLAADLTVTLGLPKVGLYLKQGPELSGEVRLGDIGLTPAIIDQAPPRGRLTDVDELIPHLPPRPAEGHKGLFGHVFLAGGAKGKTGALVLAASGAARSGVGLITALHPASLAPIYETKLTETMTLALPEDEFGELSAEAGPLISHYANRSRSQALGLGPGLGLGTGAAQTVQQVVREFAGPLVLDADALTHLSLISPDFNSKQVILTPHPGEAARLLGVSTANIQNDRLGAARQIATRYKAVVILKGRYSLIVEPGGKFYLNPTGGPHLATGGSGDVLTGLVAGLLAQGLEAFPAAALAVWLHGRAGDLTRQDLGGPCGLLPTEVACRLPRAWGELYDN